mmetsp:Transcript_21632/g.69036  ORF Transcript_21632/g.69036 Transcript_21632/m.69036 type:complete len:307 (-) Transcript_21632:49-969(-)
MVDVVGKAVDILTEGVHIDLAGEPALSVGSEQGLSPRVPVVGVRDLIPVAARLCAGVALVDVHLVRGIGLEALDGKLEHVLHGEGDLAGGKNEFRIKGWIGGHLGLSGILGGDDVEVRREGAREHVLLRTQLDLAAGDLGAIVGVNDHDAAEGRVHGSLAVVGAGDAERRGAVLVGGPLGVGPRIHIGVALPVVWAGAALAVAGGRGVNVDAAVGAGLEAAEAADDLKAALLGEGDLQRAIHGDGNVALVAGVLGEAVDHERAGRGGGLGRADGRDRGQHHRRACHLAAAACCCYWSLPLRELAVR